MAGYRAAMVAGDQAVIEQIVHARRHLGLMAPEPIQQALVSGLADSDQVASTRAQYQQRRRVVQPAFESAGFQITGGDAGLYLWATAGEQAMVTLERLADQGILVAPGHFYGPGGSTPYPGGADRNRCGYRPRGGASHRTVLNSRDPVLSEALVV